MRKRRYKTHSGPVNASKIRHDGILFSSKLEKYCYTRLKQENLYEGYENETFTLVPSFSLCNRSYERQSNGKGEIINRGGEGSTTLLGECSKGKTVRGITYTPDFCGKDFIIETKGRANETFPIRWKLFKLYLKENNDKRTLYKPQNQGEIDVVIELIKKNRNG